MGTQEQMQAIYARLHENRYEHVEQARRARDMQAYNACLVEQIENFRLSVEFPLAGFLAGVAFSSAAFLILYAVLSQ